MHVEFYVGIGMKMNAEVERHLTLLLAMVELSGTVPWYVPVTLIQGRQTPERSPDAKLAVPTPQFEKRLGQVSPRRTTEYLAGQ